VPLLQASIIVGMAAKVPLVQSSKVLTPPPPVKHDGLSAMEPFMHWPYAVMPMLFMSINIGLQYLIMFLILQVHDMENVSLFLFTHYNYNNF
jgi:hypothetical protein